MMVDAVIALLREARKDIGSKRTYRLALKAARSFLAPADVHRVMHELDYEDEHGKPYAHYADSVI